MNADDVNFQLPTDTLRKVSKSVEQYEEVSNVYACVNIQTDISIMLSSAVAHVITAFKTLYFYILMIDNIKKS